jgi:hypothetical protein
VNFQFSLTTFCQSVTNPSKKAVGSSKLCTPRNYILKIKKIVARFEVAHWKLYL